MHSKKIALGLPCADCGPRLEFYSSAQGRESSCEHARFDRRLPEILFRAFLGYITFFEPVLSRFTTFLERYFVVTALLFSSISSYLALSSFGDRLLRLSFFVITHIH